MNIEQLKITIRKTLVTIGCPPHVLRAPHRGPDRFKLLRWLYLRFQEIPDNGEKVTVVTEDRLHDWVDMMGVPKVAITSEKVKNFSTLKKQILQEDLENLLQLIETIKAYNNGISSQTDDALMDLITSNMEDVFSKQCNVFPPDIKDMISAEFSKADLIDSKGRYIHEDLERLKNELHQMRLKTVELENELAKVKKGNLVKRPSIDDIKRVTELTSTTLKEEMDLLSRNMQEFNNWKLPKTKNVQQRKNNSIEMDSFDKPNKDLEGLLGLLKNLKRIREIMDSLTYYSTSQSNHHQEIATA